MIAAVVAALSGPAAAATGAPGGREDPWRMQVNVYTYVIPNQPDFAMAVLPVDFRRLHLEVRYNYEAVGSFSAFAGANGAWGDRVKLTLTPMFGGVVGEVRGLVPGLRLTLAWWKLDLFSESEYVVDLDDRDASFFYQWAELGLSPLAWLRLGVVAQRSRVFDTPLDVQRGLFAGVTIRFVTVTLYELNAGWTTPTWVVAASLTF
ncbi:MAG TPA: hypothetical protein VIF57_03595 [Polyangia bacterium]